MKNPTNVLDGNPVNPISPSGYTTARDIKRDIYLNIAQSLPVERHLSSHRV